MTKGRNWHPPKYWQFFWKTILSKLILSWYTLKIKLEIVTLITSCYASKHKYAARLFSYEALNYKGENCTNLILRLTFLSTEPITIPVSESVESWPRKWINGLVILMSVDKTDETSLISSGLTSDNIPGQTSVKHTKVNTRQEEVLAKDDLQSLLHIFLFLLFSNPKRI